jgi:transposase
MVYNQVYFQMKCITLTMAPQNMSSTEASRVVTIPASTIRKWRHHFDRYGEVPAETSKANRRRRTSGAQSLSPADLEILRQIVSDEPDLYLDEFQTKLYEQTNKKIHCSTIWRYLTKKLGWTLTKANRVAKERNELKRAEYLADLKEKVEHIEQPIFIDETHKDKLAGRRNRAWHVRGTRNDISKCFNDYQNHRYTMIGKFTIPFYLKGCMNLILVILRSVLLACLVYKNL